MELKRKFTLRRVAQDILLVPAERNALNFDGMLTLNEMGAEIWQMLPDVGSEAEIVRRLAEGYDAPPEEIQADVADFLGQLREFGIL